MEVGTSTAHAHATGPIQATNVCLTALYSRETILLRICCQVNTSALHGLASNAPETRLEIERKNVHLKAVSADRAKILLDCSIVFARSKQLYQGCSFRRAKPFTAFRLCSVVFTPIVQVKCSVHGLIFEVAGGLAKMNVGR